MNRVFTTEEIGKIVKARRKERHLTQAELAMYADTGTRFISDLENGKSTIQLGKVLDVIAMLGLDMEIRER
jgi:transcriptional regulator, y4mF family